MLRFFKSKNPMIRLLIPLIAILFVYPLSEELIRLNISENQAFLYKNLLIFLKGKHFIFFYKLLIVLFLSINSIYFSQILLAFKFFRKLSYLHAFILLFLFSFAIKLTDCLPALITMSLFLLSLKLILKTLRKKSALFDFFNVGLLMSFASFFWFNAIYFSVIIFIGLLMLRTINWREWFVPFVGIFIPYFIIISSYYIIFSNFDIIFDIFKLVTSTEGLPIIEMNTKIALIYTGIISGFSTLFILGKYRSFETNIQDFYRIFFLLFLFSLAILFLIPGYRFSAILFIPISLTIPLSRYFISSKRRLFKEITFDLFLIAVIINQLELPFLKF